MCRCTPPMTCVLCIAASSLNTHQILSLSAYPFLSYSLAANFYTHLLPTCQVPQWLPRSMGVGSIHCRRDVATHQRRPFVDRTRSCRDISSSKASRGRIVSCRVRPLILRFVRCLRKHFALRSARKKAKKTFT